MSPLNLGTTKIPQLGAGNTFTGNQTVNGNLGVVNKGTYQPFSVQSSSTFGTWMTLGNTSAGGHTWSIISAGGSALDFNSYAPSSSGTYNPTARIA